MATNTYVALDKITVGSAVASVTFSSIPSGYTDLVIVGNLGTTSGSANIALQVGNTTIDTGSNYSFTNVNGDGSSAASSRASNQAQIYIDYSAYPTTTLTSAYIWQIQNYSNTTTYKTVLGRSNTASRGTNATVGLWRSTSAINTIKLDTQSTTFLSGSTFSLYGIAAAGVSPAAKATGGTIYSDDTYYYHVFGSTGTFTPLQSLTADFLVIAGGGAGGRSNAGGGGAGGLRSSVIATGGGGSLESSLSLTATNYTVTVGAGGAINTNANNPGGNGSNSTFSTITSTGGGGGGGAFSTGGTSGVGQNGGSGGGGASSYGVSIGGGTGTTNQGYAGGANSTSPERGGAGGGAGAVGTAGSSVPNGGAGVALTALGLVTGLGQLVSNDYYFAGGGGGGAHATATAGSGGAGGGGAGSGTNTVATSASANTGGGGGGGGSDASYNQGDGGNGGSGLVIIRYAK